MHGTNSLPIGEPIIPLETIAQIVRDTVILEFAPTLVCIVLAGVIGSKIASELGNMRVSEQIDALEIMGINTKAYLVIPKDISLPDHDSSAGSYFNGAGYLGRALCRRSCGIFCQDELFDRGLLLDFIPYNVTFALKKPTHLRLSLAAFLHIMGIM